MKINVRRAICLFFVLSIISQAVFAQAARDDLAGYNDPPSRLRGVIEKFGEDYGILNRSIRRRCRLIDRRGLGSSMGMN